MGDGRLLLEFLQLKIRSRAEYFLGNSGWCHTTVPVEGSTLLGAVPEHNKNDLFFINLVEGGIC